MSTRSSAPDVGPVTVRQQTAHLSGPATEPATSTILLVEDDLGVSRSITAALVADGHRVIAANSGANGLVLFRQHSPDLVLLDLTLPDTDGLTLLGDLRRRFSVPVVLVTARDSVSDRVGGLDLGADDYITKPFDIAELRARVRAALRRGEPKAARTSVVNISDGAVLIDTEAKEVTIGEEKQSLPPREYDLLLHLAQRLGTVQSKGQLLDAVWGGAFYSESTVIEHVRRLRRRLEPVADRVEIRTAQKSGYGMFEL